MKQWMSRAAVGALAGGLYAAAPVNFLIIAADDMNFDSVGCYGCPLEGVTPAIDTLASQGIRFEHAHVASTACYPSRSAISTGRRGHRSGGEGFFYLRFPNVPTVQQLLQIDKAREGRGDESSRYFTPEEIPIHPTEPHRWIPHEDGDPFGRE